MADVINFSTARKTKQEKQLNPPNPPNHPQSQGYFFNLLTQKVDFGGAMVRAFEKQFLEHRVKIQKQLNSTLLINVKVVSKLEIIDFNTLFALDEGQTFTPDEQEYLKTDKERIMESLMTEANTTIQGVNTLALRLQKEGDLYNLFETVGGDEAGYLNLLLSYTFASFTDSELLDMKGKNYYGYSAHEGMEVSEELVVKNLKTLRQDFGTLLDELESMDTNFSVEPITKQDEVDDK